MEKIKLLSLFSGIGAFERGFEIAGLDFEVVGYCEWDKYASKSYSEIHNISEELNWGDITKVDERLLTDFDLMTYGFPCQDISVAGKQAGISEGTRSGLLYEALRIARHKKPKIMIAENVKALVSKKFKPDFEKLLNELEEMGYNNYWRVLNAKDYGIPQNRERVFVISIRKDIDNKTFEWPEAFDNGLRLKDFLEDEVDEKYYISNEKAEKLILSLNETGKANTNPSGRGMNGNVYMGELSPTLITNKGDGLKIVVREATKQGYAIAEEGDSINIQFPDSKTRRGRVGKGVAQTLETSCNQATIRPCLTPDRAEKRQNGRRFKDDGEPSFTLTGQDRHGVLQVGNIVNTGNWDNPQRGRIYSPDGCSPSLNTVGGGGLEPKIVILDDTKSESFGGGKIFEDCPTLRDSRHGHKVINTAKPYRIRKLTPLECFRLMGFSDEDFNKCVEVGISDSQLYKQAGNSIVTNVIAEIAEKLKKSIL